MGQWKWKGKVSEIISFFIFIVWFVHSPFMTFCQHWKCYILLGRCYLHGVTSSEWSKRQGQRRSAKKSTIPNQSRLHVQATATATLCSPSKWQPATHSVSNRKEVAMHWPKAKWRCAALQSLPLQLNHGSVDSIDWMWNVQDCHKFWDVDVIHVYLLPIYISIKGLSFGSQHHPPWSCQGLSDFGVLRRVWSSKRGYVSRQACTSWCQVWPCWLVQRLPTQV